MLFIMFLLLIFLSSSCFLLFFYSSYFFLLLKNSNTNYVVAKKHDFLPRVSIVVPVYNEEKVIESKLQNLFDIEYPKDKLEIIVVDDGSTDKTREIVQQFSKNGVRMLSLEKREGKIFALNLAFKNVIGDIVVTTDADVHTYRSVLNDVIPYFADSKIGAVSATQKLVNVNQNRYTIAEGHFQSFYNFLRRAESSIDSTIVLNGEFTAIRKGVIGEIPPDASVDDVEIPIIIRKKGYRCLIAPEATFLDFAPAKLTVSWKQKIRRSQGIIMALWRHKDAFLNPKYGKFGKVIYPSEFLMNIICPYLMLTAIISGLSLVITDIYLGLSAIGLTLLVLSALLLLIKLGSSRHDTLGSQLFKSIPNLFSAQFLLFLGSLRFLTNRHFHKWEKIEETRKSL